MVVLDFSRKRKKKFIDKEESFVKQKRNDTTGVAQDMPPQGQLQEDIIPII